MPNNGLPQVTILRNDGAFGAGRGRPDGICGYIANVPAAPVPTAPATYALGDTLLLSSLRQAEAQYGIDEAYDLANQVLVWHNLREFFRLGGRRLYLMLVDSAIVATQDALVDIANAAFAPKLLADAQGYVRALGVGFNPGTAAPAPGTDLAQMSEDAVVNAQALADQEWGYKRPVDVFIEGLDFQSPPAAATATSSFDAPDVSLCINQCGITAAKDPAFATHALVGTALGLYAARRVHESIGWVEPGNIVDATDNIYTDYRTSGGLAVSAYSEAGRDDLDDKGYIFPRSFNGYAGVYLNDSYTCAASGSDFIYVERNRTLKKAARTIYTALVPHLNRPIAIDANTGRLKIGERKQFEGLIRDELLAAMTGEIESIGQLRVDPMYDENNTAYPSFATDPTLRVLVAIRPIGKIEQIEVRLGFAVTL